MDMDKQHIISMDTSKQQTISMDTRKQETFSMDTPCGGGVGKGILESETVNCR
jgi:hypothetical protein